MSGTKQLALYGGTPVRRAPYPAWPVFDERELQRLSDTLRSGIWWSTEGIQVKTFEQRWAEFCGVDHCVAVTNGTHALEVALLAANVGEGDEVIVTDFSFFASASAVATVNAIPILVDIDPRTFCIDTHAVAAAISPRTKAVIAVHIAGHPADLDALSELCRVHKLILIEDCAHAHGSAWKGRPVGGIGDLGTFSFQQSKLLTAGEGGVICIRNANLAAQVRSFADCGRQPGEWFYSHFKLGGNFRLSEWQGAILNAQLDRFQEQNQRRNANALFLNVELSKIAGIIPQYRDPRTTAQGYYCYLFRIDEEYLGITREQMRLALVAEGIPLTMSYPEIHRTTAFTNEDGWAPRLRRNNLRPNYRNLNLPNSELAAASTLWCKHQLLMGTQADAASLIEAINKVIRHRDEFA